MPITVAVFVAGAFGYMGLPLMAGFAAELFIFLGSFGAFAGSVWFTAAAMFGIVVVAGYLLYAMQRTLFGTFELETDYEVGPAAFHDVAPLVVLILLVILLGVDPSIFYDMIQNAVDPLVPATGGGV
jgi:NADH-quinone oxidoreductase subunit M